MKFFRFSYVGTVLAGALLTISCRYFILVLETSKLKTEVIYLQQTIEARNVELLSKRQQLQAQQDKLLKGSAISETVGPAVVRDIAALAEKPGNPRLRDLLAKHGIQVTAAASIPGGSVPSAARKGGN
jgi:hypothetical protein